MQQGSSMFGGFRFGGLSVVGLVECKLSSVPLMDGHLYGFLSVRDE
jgi:hypothetical protein